MSDRLTMFLVNLATDPDRLQEFARDPGGALDAAGLTAEERAAVLSRDTAVVRQALGQSEADHMTQTASTAQRRKFAAKKKAAAKRKTAKKKTAKKKTAKKSRRAGGGKKR